MGYVRKVTVHRDGETEESEIFFLSGDVYRVGKYWRLVYDSFELKRHGVRKSVYYNILYSNPRPYNHFTQHALRMKYNKPFWNLEGREWELFVKRCNKFTEYKEDEPTLHPSVLESVREEARDNE